MNNVRYVEISEEDDGQRLDNYLIKVLKGVPKSHVYRIIRQGEVRINKKRAKPSSRILPGDCIRIPPIRTAMSKELSISENFSRYLKASVIFEDSDLLVINKPCGIAVHGGSGLSLGVIEAFRKMRNDLPYLELVHRLDKETSGCLLMAKKRSTLKVIQGLLSCREVNKQYYALLYYPWKGNKTMKVDVPLEKNILKSGERLVVIKEGGKESETHFSLIENYQHMCLVDVFPKTGRTHQIRVHSSYIGHPIVGDSKYAILESQALQTAKDVFDAKMINNIKTRLYLHARRIQFNLNGKDFTFEASLDAQFIETLKQLRTNSGTGADM